MTHAHRIAIVLAFVAHGAARALPPGDSIGSELHGVFRLDNGLVLPYPLDNLFRGWVECTGRGHHKALDIGGVGVDGGLGSAVLAIGKGTVTQIGLPADDPARFGTPLIGPSTVTRSSKVLPAWKDVPGYGRVHFFTRDYGRHRSGGVISLKLSDGPLSGHEVHYLHIAAARPGLAVGDVVEAGDELGLLGGTAVLDAAPHLHLSIENPAGKSLDIGGLFGIGATRVPCRAGRQLTAAIRARYTKAAKVLMTALRNERTRNVVAAEPIATCGETLIEGDFADGKVLSHRFVVPAPEGGALVPFTLALERIDGARWAPRIQIEDLRGNALFTGTLAKNGTRKRFGFKSLASGKRGIANVAVTPKKPESVAVKVMAWPTHKRWLKGARWRLKIDRSCP